MGGFLIFETLYESYEGVTRFCVFLFDLSVPTLVLHVVGVVYGVSNVE